MASIESAAFSKPAYTPGEQVTLTVDYTPDTPGVTSKVFTVSVVVQDQAGNAVAEASVPLVVNTPQPGDTVHVTDDGQRAWVMESDNGSVAVFTTSA